MMSQGKLFLIPLPIAENTLEAVINSQVKAGILQCQYFLAENNRTARRFISSLKMGISIEDLVFEELNKKTDPEDINRLIAPVFKGYNVGVMSEAGCPGVADPGSLVVDFAHRHGIAVVPLVGPSSIFLALMASGLNGQSFVFHGYIPIEKSKRFQKLKTMEKNSSKFNQTQIFMDTPYRNKQLLKDIMSACQGETKLSIAADITGSREFITTKSISDWKKQPMPELHKVPAIFSLFAS